MANDAKTADAVATLLRRSADAERRLLKRERRAEVEVEEQRARLAEEQGRLDRALLRVERHRAGLAVAVADLRARQAARADGPAPAEGVGTAAHPPVPDSGASPGRPPIGAAATNGTSRGEESATV